MIGIAIAAFVGTLVLSYIGALILGQGFFVALMLATTSVGVVVPTLRGARQETTHLGRAIMVSAIVADFATVLGAAIYAVLFERGVSADLLRAPILLIASAGLFLALRWVRTSSPEWLHRFVAQDDPKELGVRAAFAAMFGFTGLAEVLGVEPILGAFLAGIVFSLALPNPHALQRKMAGFSYGFLIPIFFIDVGIRFRLDVLFSSEVMGTVAVLLAAAIVVKVVPAALFLARGFHAKEVFAIGVLLSARLSLIIAVAELGVELGIVTRAIEGAVIVVALLTTTLAPIAFERLVPVGARGPLLAR